MAKRHIDLCAIKRKDLDVVLADNRQVLLSLITQDRVDKGVAKRRIAYLRQGPAAVSLPQPLGD